MPFSSIDSAVAASGGKIAEGYEILPYRENRGEQSQLEYLIVSKMSVITGKDLKTARKSSDSNGRPAVGFFLTAGGSKLFALATEQHVGEKLAIVLDNVVSSAPVINERIESEGIIHGQFTAQQADDLALLLRSGALACIVESLAGAERRGFAGERFDQIRHLCFPDRVRARRDRNDHLLQALRCERGLVPCWRILSFCWDSWERWEAL